MPSDQFNYFMACIKLKISKRTEFDDLQKAKVLSRIYDRNINSMCFSDIEIDEVVINEEDISVNDCEDEKDVDKERRVRLQEDIWSQKKPLFSEEEQVIDINERGEYGRTSLHLAVLSQDVDRLESLLDLGADPRIRDNNDMTPYILAHLEKWKEGVVILGKYKYSGHFHVQKPKD